MKSARDENSTFLTDLCKRRKTRCEHLITFRPRKSVRVFERTNWRTTGNEVEKPSKKLKAGKTGRWERAVMLER